MTSSGNNFFNNSNSKYVRKNLSMYNTKTDIFRLDSKNQTNNDTRANSFQ